MANVAQRQDTKRIIQIQAAPPGWFVLYLESEGEEPPPEEIYHIRTYSYFVIPMAGWAVWEDVQTGTTGISPFMNSGQLLDKTDRDFSVDFRPDWLNLPLNGTSTVVQESPCKNRLELEIRKITVRHG